jgi:hemoglobin-like flavoprotein
VEQSLLTFGKLMSSHEIQLIRETFSLVEERAEVVALVFYQRLFTLDPSLRPLFDTQIEKQGEKFTQMLGVVVALLEKPFALGPSLQALGRRHSGYGVEDRHYAMVGVALFDTLQECLRSAFTPEVMAAWAALYAFIAKAMQRGATDFRHPVQGSTEHPHNQILLCPQMQL